MSNWLRWAAFLASFPVAILLTCATCLVIFLPCMVAGALGGSQAAARIAVPALAPAAWLPEKLSPLRNWPAPG